METSPEQMAACTALAESLSSSTGLFTRVVGWYHSHPHITVLPSHVDVNTQVRQETAAAAAAMCVLAVGLARFQTFGSRNSRHREPAWWPSTLL